MTPAPTPDVDGDLPFSLRSRAVFVPAAETLVVADLHLGRGSSSAVDAPIDDSANTCSRLDSLLAETGAETVVVAGDLLHTFDRVPRGVEDALTELESTIADADTGTGTDTSLIVTPGNHDTMLSTAFDGETSSAHRLADGETVVCHGHERPDADAGRYVIGHDHPALSIEGRKRPCFLFGPGAYEGADVLVLPAFTELAGGATVNGMYASDFQSPLVADADAFHPVVWDDETDDPLWFPPLGECRRLL